MQDKTDERCGCDNSGPWTLPSESANPDKHVKSSATQFEKARGISMKAIILGAALLSAMGALSVRAADHPRAHSPMLHARGTFTIKIEGERHDYDLEYSLPKQEKKTI
jgi:hypothetical protein